MRVSILQTDKGYHPMASCLLITLDGSIIDDVLTADSETGEVLRYDMESDKLEILTGFVSIYTPSGLHFHRLN